MNRRFLQCAAIAFGFGLSQFTGFAQDAITDHVWSLISSGEYSMSETYVGEAGVRRGSNSVDHFDENDVVIRYVMTPRTKIGVLRIGVEWERFWFGFSRNAPIPDTLQSISLVLGLDTQLSDSILLRVEAQPGMYNT